jgi:hypothetical protein
MDSKSCIVFWKYDSNRSFAELNQFQNIEDAQRLFEVEVEIPLVQFEGYLWEEQIFVILYDTYVNEYRKKMQFLDERCFESSKSSVFFNNHFG